jgi:hypothetical protein
MPAIFSLRKADYRLLELAILRRFQRVHGWLNVSWFMQVFAWMFITLAVFTFYKLWQRSPDTMQPFGTILLFAATGFLFASFRPLAAQWVYHRYVAASDPSFTAEQSIDIESGALVLQSSAGRSVVPRTAIIDHSADDRNYYLFVTGVQAITVPRSAAHELGTAFTDFLSARAGEA